MEARKPPPGLVGLSSAVQCVQSSRTKQLPRFCWHPAKSPPSQVTLPTRHDGQCGQVSTSAVPAPSSSRQKPAVTHHRCRGWSRPLVHPAGRPRGQGLSGRGCSPSGCCVVGLADVISNLTLGRKALRVGLHRLIRSHKQGCDWRLNRRHMEEPHRLGILHGSQGPFI